MSFGGKVVVVTGASSGIGAATAQAFAREGADVVLVAPDEVKLTAVADSCPHTALVICADLSLDDNIRAVVNQTIAKYGKIDIIVNNAGILRNGSILDGKLLEAYDEIFAINLRAIVHLTMLAAPYLIKTKGCVVNISSIGGEKTPIVPQLIPYATSKAGLNHFTKGAALELAPHGVRVNAISPGPVRTDMIENSGYDGTWEMFALETALKRVAEPEEIADLVLYLASKKARSITGSIFVSDNGMLLKG